MDKILTIGIPSYNAAKTLKYCLDSLVIEEVLNDIQIVIVNDGSKDKTSEIGHSFEEKYPDTIIVIDKENGGHGSGINTTIERAVGKYMKIVDSDDTVDRDGFIELINELKNTNADLILTPYYKDMKGKKEFISYLNSNEILEKKMVTIEEKYVDLRLAMHSITYRTQLLKDSNYKIDENCFYVDVEYSIYYLLNITNILLLDQPVYCYMIGGDNQSVSIKNMQKNIDQHTYVSKQLISFFENEYKNIKNSIYETLICQNIVNMILITEYRIIFSIPDSSESQKKLLDMERYLKDYSPILYTELIHIGKKRHLKIISLLSLLRKLNYFGYSIIRRLLWNRLKTF